MGKAKTWSPEAPEELEGAAKACVDSTLDKIRRAEQCGDEFAAKIHNAFES